MALCETKKCGSRTVDTDFYSLKSQHAGTEVFEARDHLDEFAINRQEMSGFANAKRNIIYLCRIDFQSAVGSEVVNPINWLLSISEVVSNDGNVGGVFHVCTSYVITDL